MNIGFDLDKIFIDYPFLVPSKIIDLFYKEKTNHELRYRIPSKIEQIIRIFSHHPLLRPPITHNLNFVKNLTLARKNKYYLISSRFSFLKKRTTDLVIRYNLEKIFDAMYFNYSDNQPHLFKNKVIKKMDLDMYVDDDFELLRYLRKENPSVKFFWLNKKLNKKLASNLSAVTDLSKMFA